MMYRRVDGAFWESARFFNSLCVYHVVDFRVYVELCSVLLISDGW
jgi:hypothetical protein